MKMCSEYLSIKKDCLRGWHTWNVNSVLSHVLMPGGLALSLCVKEYRDGGYLREALIGRQSKGAEEVFPLAHCSDYTSLRFSWRDLSFVVETANDGDQFVMRITPEKKQLYPAMLVLECGFLWQKPGHVSFREESLLAEYDHQQVQIRAFGSLAEKDLNISATVPYLTLALDQIGYFYTGEKKDDTALDALIEKKKSLYSQRMREKGENAPLYEAIQCAMNWDTIYDATHQRLISPVSRIWSTSQGGYVLFCWDTYFAGALAGTFDMKLTAFNLFEITAERTKDGFVPNFCNATGMCSSDRSQPPVGSAMTLLMTQKKEWEWMANSLYPALLEWNSWFYTHRSHPSGALGWGSDPYQPIRDNYWESEGVNDRFGAALESGLDNSPMYDDIPFDREKHLMCLEDVGLTGLFILDCRALIALAKKTGHTEDIPALKKRLEAARRGLDTLWDSEIGFYCNRRTDTLEYSHRFSPTNFYALFDSEIPPERLTRVQEHYYNGNEFYGEYVLPSIIRKDPAFPEQDYWRGRIWAPMNFLVYLALCGHPLPEMRRDLAERSRALFLKEWNEHRHIHENYSAVTGEGCDKPNSDRFYHWGALLPYIWLMECGETPDLYAALSEEGNS